MNKRTYLPFIARICVWFFADEILGCYNEKIYYSNGFFPFKGKTEAEYCNFMASIAHIVCGFQDQL